LSEIEFLKQIKDDPLALTILGGVVLIKIIEYLIKYAPRMISFLFTKEKKLPFWKWQTFVIERINEIESKIEKLSSFTLVQEQFTSKISEGTLTNQLFSDELWPFLRLKAFRRLIAMKKNGRIWSRGLKLILESKETIEVWFDVLETELGIDIVDEAYYKARLDEIQTEIIKRINEGF
jgi:hypothetical protein